MLARDTGVLERSVLAYGAVLLVGGLIGGVRTALTVRAAERSIHRVRSDALAGILRIDPGAYDRAQRGDLLSRVSTDTEALSDAARWLVPDATRYVIDLATALVAVALLHPLFAVAALAAAPPMAIAGAVLRKRSAVVYPRYRSELAGVVGQVTETVEAATTVRAFGRRADRLARLEEGNAAVTARYLDGTSMRNRFYATLTTTRVTATALVVLVAGLLATGGTITVGTAAAGAIAVTSVFGPIAWLTELVDQLLSARAALDRVVGAALVPEEATAGEALPARGEVELEGVSFAYLPGRPVLDGIDLTITSGERVAVVGETGAGKSTLGRLIVGLVQPDRGTVRVGGIDLTAAAPDDRRRRLVLLTQEAWCIDGTIAENLRLTAPEATDADLATGIDALGLTAWVAAHPDGLQREVGSNGDRLSTGERQLVALLRAVLTDPAVVVLDEATAVLDPEIEALVGTALDRALTDRTVVVIAHRPETAARCDRVIDVADHHVSGRLDKSH
jgi:ABC-type multidrug transport system fused ATPase/permease subunit